MGVVFVGLNPPAPGLQTVQSMRRNLKNVFGLEKEDLEKYVMLVFFL